MRNSAFFFHAKLNKKTDAKGQTLNLDQEAQQLNKTQWKGPQWMNQTREEQGEGGGRQG